MANHHQMLRNTPLPSAHNIRKFCFALRQFDMALLGGIHKEAPSNSLVVKTMFEGTNLSRNTAKSLCIFSIRLPACGKNHS